MRINYLETNEILFDGMDLHQLVEDAKTRLLADDFSGKTLEKLEVLYETKEMNPPYHFSLEFLIGTYLPFMAPFVMSML